MSDKKLLKYYNMGWNDSSHGTDKLIILAPLLQRAYIIGWLDFIVGDDIRSVDMQTADDILKNIRMQEGNIDELEDN